MSGPDSTKDAPQVGFRAFTATISEIIDKIIMWICAILLILMTLDLLMGVFCRYVLLNPFIWTEEVSRYMMIWVAGLAMSSCIKRGEHLTIRFLVDFFPCGVAFVLDLFLRVILFGFLVILTWYGVDLVHSNLKFSSQALDISMAFPVSVVPVSGALMLIQLVIVTHLRLTSRGKEKESE